MPEVNQHLTAKDFDLSQTTGCFTLKTSTLSPSSDSGSSSRSSNNSSAQRLAPVIYSSLGQNVLSAQPAQITRGVSSERAAQSYSSTDSTRPSTSNVPADQIPSRISPTSPSSSSVDTTSSSESSTVTAEPQYPQSFAHIVELITSGKEIPGIRQIPNIALGETAASKSQIPARRKPWET